MNDLKDCPFPKAVTVRLLDRTEGVAVSVGFEMRHKNDYTYIAFLGSNGSVTISDKELLESFDESRSKFLMDYGDPRTEFTGKITAKVLKASELLRAQEAFLMFRKHLSYPRRYEEQLRTAIALADDQDQAAVKIDVHY